MRRPSARAEPAPAGTAAAPPSVRRGALQGHADRARPDQELQGPAGRQRRLARRARGRGRRPARPQRRGQDHLLLHGHRARAGRCRAPSRSTATTSPRMPMYRRARLGIGYLPQEASIFRGLSVEDNIRAVLEVDEKNREASASSGSTRCSRSSTSRICARRRRSRCRAASGGGSRSPARWPVEPELHAARRALRRRRSDRGRRHPAAGAPSDGARHRRADHRPQCARDARPDRPRLYHPCRPGADPWPARRDRRQSGRAPALSGRRLYAFSSAFAPRLRDAPATRSQLDKQEPGQFCIAGCREAATRPRTGSGRAHGAWRQTAVAAVAVAGDDAAAAAVDPAAAAHPFRARALRRGGDRAQSAARAATTTRRTKAAPRATAHAGEDARRRSTGSRPARLERRTHRRPARHRRRKRLSRRAGPRGLARPRPCGAVEVGRDVVRRGARRVSASRTSPASQRPARSCRASRSPSLFADPPSG